MRSIYILAMLLLSVISCSEADLMLYGDEPRVYLGGYTRAESMTFYYDTDDVVRDTLYVYVETMGGPRDYDRAVNFKQVTVCDVEYTVENGVKVDSVVTENPYNAVADKHFVAFDSEEARKLMVIPAGEVSANIPIILLRDVSLKEEIYYLTLQLIENDEFKIGGVTKDVEYAITFADKLIKPNFWDLPYQGSYYFGKYSMRKHEFMIEVAGGKIDDEWWRSLYGASSVTGLLAYYQSKFKTELDKYNSDPENIANGLAPMREIVGDPTSNLVTF